LLTSGLSFLQDEFHPFIEALLPHVRAFAYTWFNLQARKRKYFKKHEKRMSKDEERRVCSPIVQRSWEVRALAEAGPQLPPEACRLRPLPRGGGQAETPGPGQAPDRFSTALPALAPARRPPLPLGWGPLQCHHTVPLLLFADAEQSGSPRAGMGSDQEDSKPITLDTTDFQESFVTSGVFSVTELIQVSRTPVVTGTGPNFSLGELQGHLAYDLNPASTGMRRTLPSTSSSGSKRHKSGSMEEDVDTSPGGDYYTSPSSPTSSSRNWTEDMEGGGADSISSPVKKTEMDKSPFHSPSPQDSPRLSSFTQHHRPVIAVHSGIARSPHPTSALHFPTTSILPQTCPSPDQYPPPPSVPHPHQFLLPHQCPSPRSISPSPSIFLPD
uniref:Nuclear factor I C n=1 Tax=Panthera tigris altaica TaxID=74533 RepID=A0A8C9MED8_PANTA